MDPLSITVAAFTSAKMLFAVGERLYKEQSSYQEQARAMRRFCDSAKALGSVIGLIEEFVAENTTSRLQRRWPGVFSSLNDSLTGCLNCTDEAHEFLSKLERSSNSFTRQVRRRLMEGDFEKRQTDIHNYMQYLNTNFLLLQMMQQNGGQTAHNPLFSHFDNLVAKNAQVPAERSLERRHVRIAMQQLADASLQSHPTELHPPEAPSHTDQPPLQMFQASNFHMSLDVWLTTAQGLPIESHDMLVQHSMVELLDLEYSQTDVDPYVQPIRRLYHLLIRPRDDVVLRSDMRPLLIQAANQCRFAAHCQRYIDSISRVETIKQFDFESLFRSLVNISISLERARVEEIANASQEAGMLELESENRRQKAEDPSECYRSHKATSQYLSGFSFQYIAWSLTRVWTQRLRHLERLWRSRPEGNFCDEEETQEVLDLVKITSRFGDILQADGELLDLLELARCRIPFNETTYKDFPHADVQRLASDCRAMFARLASLVVEFKTIDARNTMQKHKQQYERDFAQFQMEYISQPMHRADWIRLGISMRLDSIKNLPGGPLADLSKTIEQCKAWVAQNPTLEKVILDACRATDDFQNELRAEHLAKVSFMKSKAMQERVTVTFTNLRLEGLKKRGFFSGNKRILLQFQTPGRNAKSGPRFHSRWTHRKGDAPPSWSEDVSLLVHRKDTVHVLVRYEGAKDVIAETSFEPSVYFDFYTGQSHREFSIELSSDLRVKCSASCPPSPGSKQDFLPPHHRPKGWIGRFTTELPARSYHKRYMTGEYTLLDPLEKTAHKTVVPMLVEKVAKLPVFGEVVGAVADQVGMASGFVYGRLWGSWK